jgi:anti-sigma regulatory factor (Ser/Thr protein kinase)
MSAVAARASESAEDLAIMASDAVIGSLTIPGHPEHVSEARSFVVKTLGEDEPATEVAVLLASEVVTNAVLHTNSRLPGGTVSIAIFEIGGGVRIEVSDDGSRASAPVVKGDGCARGGHGLFLVQSLANEWGYTRDELGTTVWFSLTRGRGYPAQPDFPG